MKITEINLSKRAGVEKLLQLLDAYHRTPTGISGGVPLTDEFRHDLFLELPQYRNAIALLTQQQKEPSGLIFGSYSLDLLAAKPFANIQLLFVRSEFQRRGMGRKLMLAFEKKARELGCCKITLEVRATNEPAKALYSKLAYSRGRFGPGNEVVEFWEKKFR